MSRNVPWSLIRRTALGFSAVASLTIVTVGCSKTQTSASHTLDAIKMPQPSTKKTDKRLTAPATVNNSAAATGSSSTGPLGTGTFASAANPAGTAAAANDTITINQVIGVTYDGVTTGVAAGTVVVQPVIDQFNACAAKGTIWLPPPDSAPADAFGVCGDPLVPWICTSGALAAQIPSYQGPLSTALTNLEAQGFQIYGGSAPADGSLNINMVALAGQTLLWHQINISVTALSGTAASILNTTGSTAPCAATFTSVITGNGGGTAPAPTLPSFTPIDTLLTANCGGASCHGAGASPQPVLVDNPSVVQAQAQTIIDQLNSGLMPLNQTMNAADKAQLISLLQAY